MFILRLISLAIFLAISVATAEPASARNKPEIEGKAPASLYKDLDLFSKVLSLVREDYVEDVMDQELIHGAIRGMISTLDPHSAFMPPDLYKELKVDTEGHFGGIGLEVTIKDTILTVVTPIEDSPAQKAGVREGDKILRINGAATREMSLMEAVRKMRGGRGTKIVLTLIRPKAKEPYEVTLTRDIIRIKSVRYEMPEEGLGYVRITSFQEGTTQELKRVLEDLRKKFKGGVKGLILDLRNNPGGLLDEAVNIADVFLESGVIVTTASRTQEIDKRTAILEGTEPEYPMVVLVNGGSASAAEIVAGALQDHKRAVILGTQSFGKGSVQTIFEMGGGAALKLTVAKYYTPKGRSIQAEGIVPDVVVAARRTSGVTAGRDQYIREKDLKGHLESESEKKGIKKSERSGKQEKESKEGPETEASAPTGKDEDYQKKFALDYLRKKVLD